MSSATAMEQAEEEERIEEATAENLDDFCEDDIGHLNAAPSKDCAQEIATLVSAIGIIDETGAKPFIRGEYCYAAVARLEYLLRSEYLRNRRVRDEADDSDTDNNEMFAKCGEFMVVTKKLVPCFRSLMEDVIRYGLQSDRSRPLLKICQCLMKMFCRFTFPLTADADQTEGYYIEYNKYHRFLEYQQTAKKALIDNEVLHQIIILMSDCGLDSDPEERSEVETDSLELTLCLLKNILSIPNAVEYDDFLQDRAILGFMEEKVMDIVVELTANIHEETEKIQYLLMDVFYQYFRMEQAESMISSLSGTANKSIGSTGSNSTGAPSGGVTDGALQQYQQQKAQRKSKMKRTRHNKWGGLSRVKLLNGATRVQSLGSHQMANENMRDRRRQARFRPIKEKKKRLYLSSKVPAALVYVADHLLRRSFTALINVMFEKLSGRPEFELSQSSDCKKWFHLISLFLHFHRLRTRQLAISKAKAEKLQFNQMKWYSPSSISCVLKEQLIHFVISRVETLFECRKFKQMSRDMDWSKLEEALHSYKEIIRCIYSMVQYGNDAVRVEGFRLFGWIFSDHRGPQLINDMIREYRAHQHTKLCLSYCIEAVFYTIQLIDKMQNEGNAMKIKTKKKKKKKRKKKNANANPMDLEDEDEEDGIREDLEDEMKRETEVPEESTVEVAGMEIHDDIEDMEDEYEFMEKDFDFQSFLRSYAANKVVAQYMYILEDYSLNSPKLNSYIVTLFNKLAFELDYAPLLFQLSYFLLFDEILNDKVMAKDKNFNIVRKFAQKIVREFFKRTESNPVLFSEILFFKTPHAVDDINVPGSVRQALAAKEEREKGARERRAQKRNQNLDDDDEDDFDFGDIEVDTAPWTDAEDTLLRNYYGTYSQQSNVLKILQDFLEGELQSERSENQIQHHLKQMGLWTGPRRKRNVQRNEAKKRVKPMEMTVDQRKTIIFHSVHKASYREQLQMDPEDEQKEYSEDLMNRKCFEWLQRKLDKLRDIIGEAIDVSSESLIDDVAIIPVESHEFDVMENRFLKDLLTKMGFLAPTKYTGTCWWRIPRELLSASIFVVECSSANFQFVICHFVGNSKTSDISMISELIKEALELPVDADLRTLCGSNQQRLEIAAFGDEEEIENEVVRAQSQQLLESVAMNNESTNERVDERAKEEASDSEEEFQFDPVSAVDENEKKKKRQKRKSSRKRKSRKRKRVANESDDEGDELGGEIEVKRRKLTVNGVGGGDGSDDDEDEEDFFSDLGGDDSDDPDENANGQREREREQDDDVSMEKNQSMNTPQIQKFRSLSLGENQNVLNAVAEETNVAENEVVPEQNVFNRSKRRFVSDSDSD